MFQILLFVGIHASSALNSTHQAISNEELRKFVRKDDLRTEVEAMVREQMRNVSKKGRKRNPRRRPGRRTSETSWHERECEEPIPDDADNIIAGNIQDLSDAPDGPDTAWLLACGASVFLMQVGFALLECGVVRASNVKQILLKNSLDASVAGLGWFLFGFPLAYGYTFAMQRSTDASGGCFESVSEHGNVFLGSAYWALAGAFSYCDPSESYSAALDDVPVGAVPSFDVSDHCVSAHAPRMDDPAIFATWFFQWSFCATGSTIVSGGVAERCRLGAYCIVAIAMSVIVYPVVVAWTWSGNGWTAQGSGAHYFDFAGSGVVHLTGGVGALIGAVACKPRPGRYENPENFAPSNVVIMFLGMFVLWFGWYGFNPGSTLGMSTGITALIGSLAAVNTTLAATTSGLFVYGIGLIRKTLWPMALTADMDLPNFCNGVLAGLVAITAPCGNVHPWCAVVIGILASFVYVPCTSLLGSLKIDDPLDAFCIHGANGIFGVLAAPIFDMGGGGLFFGWGDGSSLWYNVTKGKWEGVSKWEQLGQQALVAVSIIAWVCIILVPLFFLLNRFGILVEDHDTLLYGVEVQKAKKMNERRASFMADIEKMGEGELLGGGGGKKKSAGSNTANRQSQSRKTVMPATVRTRKSFWDVGDKHGWAYFCAIVKKIHRMF